MSEQKECRLSGPLTPLVLTSRLGGFEPASYAGYPPSPILIKMEPIFRKRQAEEDAMHAGAAKVARELFSGNKANKKFRKLNIAKGAVEIDLANPQMTDCFSVYAKISSEKFTVNLQSKPTMKESTDLALHLHVTTREGASSIHAGSYIRGEFDEFTPSTLPASRSAKTGDYIHLIFQLHRYAIGVTFPEWDISIRYPVEVYSDSESNICGFFCSEGLDIIHGFSTAGDMTVAEHHLYFGPDISDAVEVEENWERDIDFQSPFNTGADEYDGSDSSSDDEVIDLVSCCSPGAVFPEGEDSKGSPPLKTSVVSPKTPCRDEQFSDDDIHIVILSESDEPVTPPPAPSASLEEAGPSGIDGSSTTQDSAGKVPTCPDCGEAFANSFRLHQHQANDDHDHQFISDFCDLCRE